MRESRNTKSDVFSMGCVWVEMYTVIIGERLSSLTEHLQHSDDIADEDSVEDGPKTPIWEHDEKEDLSHSWGRTFAGSLNITVRWLHRLRTWLDTHVSLMAGGSPNFSALDIPTEQLARRLDYIESMIRLKPADRPSAAQLCIWLGSNDCCTASATPYDHEVLSTPSTTDESSGSTRGTPSTDSESAAAAQEPAKKKIPPSLGKEKWSASVLSGSMAPEHMSMSPTQSTHSADDAQTQASKPIRARPVRRISVVGKWMTSHLRRGSSTGTSGSSSKG
jgi:serine/threonine protein kinase